MAILARFPWVWSPAPEAEPPPPPPPAPFWTKDTPGSLAWSGRQAALLPRFQHLYPQESGIGWQKAEPPDSE